jgi:hypothetical protein
MNTLLGVAEVTVAEHAFLPPSETETPLDGWRSVGD